VLTELTPPRDDYFLLSIGSLLMLGRYKGAASLFSLFVTELLL
jgi:hypothetical protein